MGKVPLETFLFTTKMATKNPTSRLKSEFRNSKTQKDTTKPWLTLEGEQQILILAVK